MIYVFFIKNFKSIYFYVLEEVSSNTARNSTCHLPIDGYDSYWSAQPNTHRANHIRDLGSREQNPNRIKSHNAAMWSSGSLELMSDPNVHYR